MRPPDPWHLGVPLTLVCAGASLTGCFVFDGKTATQTDDTIDSGAADSEVDGRPADSGPDAAAPDPGVRCGANDWCARDKVCCLKLGDNGWFSPPTPCSPPGTCDNFAAFACDTARECGDGGVPTGDSCCATRESVTTEFRGSTCIPADTCLPTSLAVVLCTPADPTPCPAHQSCAVADSAELPPGYYVCR